MPSSAASLLRVLGHEVENVRDILPDGSDDATVAAHARAGHLILVTRDFDFADIRNYPPKDYAGIIVLELPDDAIAVQVTESLRMFLIRPELLVRLPGRLAVVEPWRVRFRPHESNG